MFDRNARLALAAILPLAAFPAAVHAAEVASTNLSVTATVLDSCIVTAPTGLVFASVNTQAATNQSVQGTIAVICTSAKTNVTVNMEGGDNEDGGQRNMKAAVGDSLLPYIITSDAGHTTPVGVNGAIYTGALTAVAPTVIPVYGTIPAGSYAAGIYSDTVRVTLNY